MKENAVEQRLRIKLENKGFRVLKFVTPGNSGTPDRFIMFPEYSPHTPRVIEVKRPDKEPTRFQREIRNQWIRRGVIVDLPVSTYEEVDTYCNMLFDMVVDDYWKVFGGKGGE